ncbi:alpha/beta fold hydrolase [Sphingopyxis sp. SE2]|jgi:pimeloyl-ACP methyl ester carboxylesterase|uniref:alpha/beta fold hydrolase n=1 Tax=unclassified Sphingopyxis TaxID=2614943 RepID=UPI00050FA146|nr:MULTISPECIES: alpha/beta fold hydrolase [unclassified Sphingopyxis]KGB57829.1 Alpha/beta hydrolase fold protein [Sphingopyxis sp. LC363]MDT7527331.1 alpha/beta fold hydrolase [Sphingopyxis sp. SE2]
MSRISGRPTISTEHVYGLSLRVARWREGAPSTPLLFLNGIGADIAAAAPLLAQIDGREVWTLDMPGVGGSPDALLPYAAPTIAAVVMEIADRLGHKVIDVAGFSWGGALAQQVAIQFPGRMRRLVLMATTPTVGAPGIGWGALLDDDMLASGLKLPTATPLGLAYQSMAMAGWTSAAMLPHLKGTPVLVLMGERDGVVPACHGQAIAELIDGAELEVVPGSHLFPFTHAATISVRISAFLDQPERAQAAA